MILTIDWFRAENGTKWHVDFVNEKFAVGHSSNGNVAKWTSQGAAIDSTPSYWSLIAPLTDPVPWDWSTTPPWINWIAMDKDGSWVMYIEEPETIDDIWASSRVGESAIIIPRSYAPKWNGSWHLSKTQRPKEVAK